MKNLLLAIIVTISIFGAESDKSYECTIQENGSCIINLTEMFPEHMYDIDDVLAYCEYVDGVLDPEADTCTIGNEYD